MEGGRTSKNDILFIYSEREHIEKQKNLVKLLSISKKKKRNVFLDTSIIKFIQLVSNPIHK